LAASVAPRTLVWAGAAGIAAAGLVVSLLFVRDTGGHVAVEGKGFSQLVPWRRRPVLVSCAQAGLVNNLNDALAWGLAPLYLAAHGASARQIGVVAALYPAVWGVGQLGTGWLSDHTGRKPLIVTGMLVQGGALAVLVAGRGSFASAAAAAVLLGAGTALVYPTLIAAISDAVSPVARAPTVGVYRFWRDMGYAAGGLIAGVLAEAIHFGGAIGLVAGLTAVSGLWVALDLPPRPSLSAAPDAVKSQ